MEEERREALIAGWAVQLLGRQNMKSKEQKVEKEQKLGKVMVVEEEGRKMGETGLNLQMSSL